MAELDPIKKEFSEALEPGDTVVIVEQAINPIPPNRPRKVYAGMWGPPEIGAVAVSALAVLMALVAYFFWVVPSGNELVKNRAEADKLEAELISAKSKYGEITSTEVQVAKIVESIDDFEARFLPVSSNGQAALYQRLNGLIAAYGLVNTTGPDYVPLETNDQNTGGDQTSEEKGRAKYRSLYPGVYVTTTLEGSYQSIRRFIREIETGRDFVVVSAVELAPSESENREKADPSRPPVTTDGNSADSSPRSAKQKGKTHGEIVSLRLELAAYFRRPTTAPALAR